jgi:mevalonate kinase
MAQAGGKVILLGEHAVVYGVEAIAAGLDRGVSASARPGEWALNIAGKPQASDSPNLRALQALAEVLAAAPHAVQVSVELPVGVGLGASAAMGVAIARALAESAGETHPVSLILKAADAWERVFHGNPSGVDAACAAFGGCLAFQRQRGARTLSLSKPLTLVVAQADPASATHEMVARVAALRALNPQEFEAALQRISALAQAAERCLANAALEELGQLFDANHTQLAEWQLSTSNIELACVTARSAGAWGAKVTGAGGGGCVIALPREGESQAILEAWQRLGFACFATQVAGSGQ